MPLLGENFIFGSLFDTKKQQPLNGPDFDQGFIMTEQIERDPISFALKGNMLPFIPFEYGGEQKIAETYYPGNPEPSVHILGSREGNVTIKGRFHDKRQPATGTRPIAATAAEVIDEMRRRGNLLKLELGEWVRYGYITASQFKMRNLRSIEYAITFFIVSESKPDQCPVIDQPKKLPRDTNEKLKEIQAALNNNLLDYPTDYPKNALDTARELISKASEAIGVVTGAVDKLLSVGEAASSTLNRAIGTIQATKTFVFRSSQRLGRLSLENEVRKKTLASSLDYGGIQNAYPDLKRESVSGGYRNLAVIQDTQRILFETQAVLSEMSGDLLRFVRSIPVARHLCKEGETIQALAVKYYGDAGLWEKILVHNKLSSTVLTPGQVVEIPR